MQVGIMLGTGVREPSSQAEGGLEGAEGFGGLAGDLFRSKPEVVGSEKLDADLSVNLGGHTDGKMRPEREVCKPNPSACIVFLSQGEEPTHRCCNDGGVVT